MFTNKKKITVGIGLLVLIFVLSAYYMFTDKAQNNVSIDPESIYENAKKSVVKIYSMDPSDKTKPARTGTGFITFLGAPKVITNKHVVEGQNMIIVESPVSTWIVQEWSEHPKLDLAILELQPNESEPSPPEGDHLILDLDFEVKPGQRVYTVGHPLGMNLAIHHGMLSAINKGKLVFSAPLSEGASGSPLINEYGKVIGVCDSYVPNAQNYNLATPISLAFITKKWNEKVATPNPEIEEYIKHISSIKTRIHSKREQWYQIVESSPEWEQWVNRTMLTRIPTDEAIEHTFLSFSAIDWGKLTHEDEAKFRHEEAILLHNSTKTLRNTWEYHKENLVASKELKPNPILEIDIGLKETEDIVNGAEDLVVKLKSYLKSSKDTDKKESLRSVIISLGSFRASRTRYEKLGTP